MISRRSLLKWLGAGFGAGAFFKTRAAAAAEDATMVCDSLLLPPADFMKWEHNATFIRDIVPGLAWVELTSGHRRVVDTGNDGPSDCWPGQRLLLEWSEADGLWIAAAYPYSERE
jgi:hypothetical protein